MAQTGLALTFWAANRVELEFTLTDIDSAGNSTALDLTGGSLTFALATYDEDEQTHSTTATLNLSSSDSSEIEITNAAGGLATVKMDATDLAGATFGGKVWFFQLEHTDGSSQPVMLAEGLATIKKNIVNT